MRTSIEHHGKKGRVLLRRKICVFSYSVGAAFNAHPFIFDEGDAKNASSVHPSESDLIDR